jgi:ribosome-associated protein
VADLRVNDRVTIPADELSVAFSRSGGPGGQNVNKVSSKVELRWSPGTTRAVGADDRALLVSKLGPRLTTTGELIVVSSLTRDQIQNRGDAEDKLAAIVRAALFRPKPRKKTRPSKGARRRRVADKRHQGEKKALRRSGDD